MGDLPVRGTERRLLVARAGAGTLLSSETLLGRLDQIEHRLRQLEEKQRLPESFFAANLLQETVRPGHYQCKSTPSALHDRHLDVSLMDHLQLLETRIQQLSRRDLKSQKNKMKVKEPKEAIDAVEKSWNEKRKMERTWLHRRWFPVGC